MLIDIFSFYLLSSVDKNSSVSNVLKKRPRYGSWCGSISDREPLKRSTSVPSLVTRWTCIRCLLDNSCSSTLVCAACDASFSIAQLDERQIGARKGKKLNQCKAKQEPKVELLKNAVFGHLTKNLNAGYSITYNPSNAKRVYNKGNFY